MRGKFIVIEGIDGSGKGTQTDMATAALQAMKVPVARRASPRRDQPSARLAVDYLKGAFGPKESVSPYIASALFAHEHASAAKELETLLAGGTHVVNERFVDSNPAYQGAHIENPAERASFIQWLYDLEYRRLGITQPDLAVFLDVSVEAAAANVTKRGRDKEITEGDLDYMTRVASIYHELAKRPGYVVIECMDSDGQLMPPEVIHEMVWRKILPIIQAP